MLSSAPFSLVSEMLEAPEVLRRFDKDSAVEWAETIGVLRRVLVSGEGSSRIFPAKNLMDRALRIGCPWEIRTEGARQAAEYDLNGFVVMAASNSGQTREVIALLEKLSKEDIPCYGVTATAGSRLTQVVADVRLLTCGEEKAVASSKSVVEQALLYQSLLTGGEWSSQAAAADAGRDVLAQTIAPEIADGVTAAPLVYFAGRNNGVAEELTLKTGEIARKKAIYLEGTYALHGVEEVMRSDEALILVEPYAEEIEKYDKILRQGVGLKVFAIASFDTPFPTIKIPSVPGFDSYLQLMAGWNVLVTAGLSLGVNLDKPERARKIGNAI